MAGILTFVETDTDTTAIQAQLYNTLPISGGITGQNRPITAMVASDDGRLVAGTYYVTFSSVVPGVSGVAVINSSDINNPWVTNAVAVILDDDQTTSGAGTVHNNIIGGLGLYFSDSASFATSWTAKIIVGGYFSSGTTIPVSSFGTLIAGAESAQKKLGIKNTGDADCTDCVLGLYPGTYFKNTTGTPINKIKITSKSTTAGKHAITTTNYNGAASPHECDVYDTLYTYNYTTSAWDYYSGPTLKVDAAGISGTIAHTNIITGMEITLDESISGDTAASIFVDSSSGAQIAPDIGGTPGTWTSTSDIILTESGGGVTGQIQDGNVAYAWVCVISSSSNKPGNLRKFILRPSGMSGGDLVE